MIFKIYHSKLLIFYFFLSKNTNVEYIVSYI